jgi:hypothetical protein
MTETCPSTYSSESACTSQAAKYVDGAPTDSSGNTLGCRLYHVNLARTDAAAAAVHCPHAGADGGGICADCNRYCSKFFPTTAVCNGKEGGKGYYDTLADCVTICETYFPKIATTSTCNAEIGAGITLKQTVDLGDESILMELTMAKEAWVGFGLSPTGKMLGSKAVIYKPIEGTVKQ